MYRRIHFLLLAFPVLLATASLGGPAATQAQPDWLDAINTVRTAAGLPAVPENTASSAGARNHSLYVVRHNMLGHTEDPNAPGFTTDGAQAGRTGDVEGQFGGGPPSAADLVASFMTGGYHWQPILDASVTSVGFGSATFQDVFPGQTPAAGAVTAAETIVFNRPFAKPPRPILWPPNGGTMPFTTFNGEETPSALVNCAGYTAPTGASLSLQLPATPQVTAATLTQVGTPGNLDSCWFTNATVQFSANDQAWAAIGHNILDGANAVVIFPRQPLTDGTYCVSVTNSGTPINWSFTVGTAPVAPPPPCGQNTGGAANPPATTTTPNANQPANTNPPATTTTPTNTTTPTTPANTTTNPTTGPNAPAQPAATTGWAGTWNTDFGVLTLAQNGNQVTGTFQDQTGNPGAITGTANGNALTATWDLAPSTPGMSTITLVLTESADGSSFTGTFARGGGATGPWNGTRAGP